MRSEELLARIRALPRCGWKLCHEKSKRSQPRAVPHSGAELTEPWQTPEKFTKVRSAGTG